MVNNNFITFEERKRLQTLLGGSLSSAQIAFELKRAKGTINKEIRINGGRTTYNAIEAQKQSELRHKNKTPHNKIFLSQGEQEKIIAMRKSGIGLREIGAYINCSHSVICKFFKENGISAVHKFRKQDSPTFLTIEQKVDALEMQMEILFEQIRILNDKNT